MRYFSNPFHTFSAVEFKQIQQISVKHCLINFMRDNSGIKASEYPQGHDPPSEESTQWFQKTKIPMLYN